MKRHTSGILRRLADGEFHSGAALARAFAVSRATVWNAVRELEAAGLTVYKVQGRGYRLPYPLSLLDRAAVARALAGRASRLAVEVLDATTSTNAVLLERAAAGARSGAVLAAEWQSAGRGRRGRAWQAVPGGGLAFSILWRFERGAGALAGLSLAVGVALARAIEQAAARVALKWPNDIVTAEGKIGGILIELSGDALGPSAAVIGIGLNTRLGPRARRAIDQAAADLEGLAGRAIDRNALLAELLVYLEAGLVTFATEGFAPFHADWERYHAHRNRQVEVTLPDGSSIGGVARGVAADGSLLLETSAGMKRFHSGEVSLRAG
ncbi:MAG: biotin--[acetyl-CoA-carboxylase] ligase [Burkholderiales bacterium]|nr:biotin--[acetyl-CoA-carboxylase] ligase [Burkholderiales bacterium]